MLGDLVFGELVKGEGNLVHRGIIVSSIILSGRMFEILFLLKFKMPKRLYLHIT